MNNTKAIRIIQEDNHLLVVEKPINILSQSDETHDPDMLTILKKYIKEKYKKPGDVYLGLIHRLDRPVGGVMVFARTSKAAARVSKQVRERNFRKIYLAVVHGKPDLDKGRLENYLVKDNDTNIVKIVLENFEESKKAILNYTVIDYKDNFSLIRIELHTGRPHQIRVQFANIGCPLYGDQKYGAAINTPGQQIALWSHQIILEHPTLKELKCFMSMPPEVYPWNMFNFEKI